MEWIPIVYRTNKLDSLQKMWKENFGRIQPEEWFRNSVTIKESRSNKNSSKLSNFLIKLWLKIRVIFVSNIQSFCSTMEKYFSKLGLVHSIGLMRLHRYAAEYNYKRHQINLQMSTQLWKRSECTLCIKNQGKIHYGNQWIEYSFAFSIHWRKLLIFLWISKLNHKRLSGFFRYTY